MREEDLNYFETPDFLESLEKYEQSIRSNMPIYMDADELTDIAEYYMIRQQEDCANKAISLAVQLHPESVDPQIFLARQEMFHDRLDNAHRICNAIYDQNDREVIFLNAELLIREQKVSQAIQLLKEAESNLESDQAMFAYDCAGIFVDYSLWKEAMEWIERMLLLQPQHPNGLLIKGEILVMQGLYQEAIILLNSILDQDPYKVAAWNLLAEAQESIELFQEALDSVEYVLAIDENNRHALLIKANCLFHLNHLTEAHAMYQAFLQNNNEDDTIYYLDAVCLTQLERYHEAAEMLDKANEISRGFSREQFNIYIQQAHVESRLRNLNKAIDALQKAKAISNEENSFDYELLLGHIYLENECYAEAEKCFGCALEKTKDKRGTLLMIGVAFAECNRYNEALTIFNLMMKLFGDDESRSAKPYLAYCYYQIGDQKNFLSYLKESISISRETTEFLFSSIFPNIIPEEYYLYAFKSVYGRYPEEKE